MKVDKTMRLAAARLKGKRPIERDVGIRVGVDLGTAYTVVMVTDADGVPLAGASVFADVVRDGIVWDFAGATRVVTELKDAVERRTGRRLTAGAVTIPPSVSASDHRAHGYVLEGAGIACTAVVDEPTAANAVLGVRDGAVVDIGGGTTGVAILRDGQVVATHDEPSGGTHLSLVIAGALGVSFEEAEKLKCDPTNHARLLPIVTPTLEKVSTIVRTGLAGHRVEHLYLVGGTAAFAGIAPVMTRITGVPCEVAPEPMLVTPLGVASFADVLTEGAFR
ncbi:MAG TPA: ethanolamine utilization protein EutJ [Propioniciclava tarda]|nr:ethanolamine utilization protein EutJ [Propioniciclava tarda]HQA31799.1 ethanolamine utilization protein EutJ [Propioniciclava tarda]HQD61529.1 ethanolamine utilization protein EutJ [Propioniciclava tarda]